MSTYAWMVTEDHLYEGLSDEKSSVGVSGPSDAPAELLIQLAQGKGIRFQMKDDDGILYYRGRFVSSVDPDATSEEAFGPLEDYGTPNAGAVTIEYRHKNGIWETL